MTAAKVRQSMIGAIGMVCLLLPHGSAGSQTDIDDISTIAWRPDGLQIATGHALGNIRLWDAVTGELLNTFTAPDRNLSLPPQIDDLSWHPTGSSLAITASATTQSSAFLWVMDASTGEVLHDLEAGVMGHDSAWSPDGTLLTSAIIREFGAPGKLGEAGANVWDVTTEQLIAKFDTDDVIFTVAWSPDGSRLASIGWAQTTIWDTQTWTALVQMGEPTHMPTTFWVAWSPDGTRVVTPGSDGLAYIWDATTGELLMTLQSGDENQLDQIEWQPGGNLLVGRSEHSLIYWDATTGQLVDRMDTSEWIGYVAWSPDGSQLLYSDHSSEHPQFAVVPGLSAKIDPLQAQDPIEDYISAISWNPDGSQLAIGYRNGDILIQDIQGNPVLPVLHGHSFNAGALDWNSDGSRLASASLDDEGPVNIWDTNNGQLLYTFEHGEPVMALYWHSQDDWLLSSSPGTDTGVTVKVWDTAQHPGTLLEASSTGAYTSIMESPDGTQIAMQNLGGKTDFWSADPLALDFELGPYITDSADPTNQVTWSMDGKQIAVGTWYRQVRVWDVTDRQILFDLQANESVNSDTDVMTTTAIVRIAYAEDSSTLTSISADGTLCTWDAATGAVVDDQQLSGAPIRAAEWSPDGTYLAYGAASGSVEIIEHPLSPSLPDFEPPSASSTPTPDAY